jgi:hypothetical protein
MDGGCPFVGTPDQVARELANSRYGVRHDVLHQRSSDVLAAPAFQNGHTFDLDGAGLVSVPGELSTAQD